MAMFTQQNRNTKIQTPLAPDKLLLSAMNGSEGMSRLFSFELSLLSEDAKIGFNDIIGKSVTVSVDLGQGKTRYFNGIISRFSQVSGQSASADDTTRVSHYRATLVPKLWLLTRSAESKIFQKKSVPEIVEAVLTDNGITDFVLKQRGSYQSRDYCVQYRETHFNFISRLLEEEGLHYYFEHNDQSHRLVISDEPRPKDPTPLLVSYQVEGISPEDAVIHAIDWSQEIRPNKYALSDFNFETPNSSLKAEIPGRYHLAPVDLEVYDYPGVYPTKAVGDKMVRVRIEEEEAQVTSICGSSNCIAFTPGYRFTLLNSYRADLNNKEYILTSVTHTVSQSYESGGGTDYGNSFACIPYDVPYRPPRVTPKPLVLGSQTAIVVGPSGEEIHTDEHGRVKVQFHWDREGKRDENSSCWIRVSQVVAGAGWGAIDIPRIGHEVIVDFLEGDPDRPIITGRVYHGMNKPPTGLPKSKMVSGMKSNTTPGGGGSNEFTMDDTKGKEKITVHGQYDMNTTVEHDQTNTVNNKFTETIKSDATIKITEGKLSHDVVAGTATFHVKGAVTEKFDATQKTTVTDSITISSTGGPIVISADSNHIYIHAATNIQLQTGASKLWMASDGNISLEGVNVTVNGSSTVTVKGGIVHSEAQAEHQTKGAIVISEGSASNTVKGAMVMLNP